MEPRGIGIGDLIEYEVGKHDEGVVNEGADEIVGKECLVLHNKECPKGDHIHPVILELEVMALCLCEVVVNVIVPVSCVKLADEGD
jgi:hypothetical protein